ncbi:PilZ domain-containing protein, partial [Francisella tularensis subsp. holarctica]|nr:PilZ domain-containing protein [Francisella tularensis subsp. holarctica]
IRISVTLTELKEQVGGEARVVSVFPQSIPSSIEHNNDKYRSIVQFIGPNAPETERVL